MASDLIEITPDGKLRLHMHPGQWRAWQSQKRFVVVLAGTQGGKTSFGPHLLWREIQRKGPGDYIVATPTFPLLGLKALPEFRKLFETWLNVGEYKSQQRQFVFSDYGIKRAFGTSVGSMDTTTRVIFGYAAEPESLESATAKAAWLDEAGQKRFKAESWDALLRRLSLAQGRAFVTTTPYNLGWLKQRLWDKWKAGDPDIEVIRFDSTENPNFPQAEFERARRDLPRWKFDLFYRAIFTRPAGLIYDSFSETDHVVARFPIPESWPRYLGLDFGGVNTAGMFYAQKPGTKQFYAYREYLAGSRTAREHVQHLREGEPSIAKAVGGAKSEGQWRAEFRSAGLPVSEPDQPDVEVGIDRVYGAHSRGEILVFSDLTKYLEQKQTYSRELDDRGEPTEKIEDKETFHLLDAERYIIGYLNRVGGKMESKRVDLYGTPIQTIETPAPAHSTEEIESMLVEAEE